MPTIECTINRCEKPATVLVILARPAEAVAGTTYWHGHLENPYCGEHAIERPSVNGIEEFRDTWTLRPLNTTAEVHPGGRR